MATIKELKAEVQRAEEEAEITRQQLSSVEAELALSNEEKQILEENLAIYRRALASRKLESEGLKRVLRAAAEEVYEKGEGVEEDAE